MATPEKKVSVHFAEKGVFKSYYVTIHLMIWLLLALIQKIAIKN